jgi:hypothetical protein
VLFKATAINGQNTFLAEAGKLSVLGQQQTRRPRIPTSVVPPKTGHREARQAIAQYMKKLKR